MENYKFIYHSQNEKFPVKNISQKYFLFFQIFRSFWFFHIFSIFRFFSIFSRFSQNFRYFLVFFIFFDFSMVEHFSSRKFFASRKFFDRKKFRSNIFRNTFFSNPEKYSLPLFLTHSTHCTANLCPCREIRSSDLLVVLNRRRSLWHSLCRLYWV